MIPESIKFFFKRMLQVTCYSWKGLTAAWNLQWAFRIEIMICLIAAPVALYLGKTSLERAVLIASILLVLIVELINSAIETVVDRISLKYNELSGRAKDIGSAAVLVTIINALIVWGVIIF